MRFILDAHLPQSLREVFRLAGHDAIHTLDLPEKNSSKDAALNEVSISEERVVVTKDTDFYYSHVLHNRPRKLVLVRTGNLGLKETKQMFAEHLQAIEEALQTCSLVELDQQRVTVSSGLAGSPLNKKETSTE
jgi:predicted nuclease of predicted toxin-antitoxin system